LSQQLLTKQRQLFVPDQELLNISKQIRSLKSTQIMRSFTRNNGHDNNRCVLGALAVEFYGAPDTPEIIANIMKYAFGKRPEKYSAGLVYEEMTVNGGVIKILPYKIEHTLYHKLVSMNDGGRTFSEIADWVELEAYKHGEYKPS
jgi:hypothetical protein